MAATVGAGQTEALRLPALAAPVITSFAFPLSTGDGSMAQGFSRRDY
jgi:hypothetical protein